MARSLLMMPLNLYLMMMREMQHEEIELKTVTAR